MLDEKRFRQFSAGFVLLYCVLCAYKTAGSQILAIMNISTDEIGKETHLCVLLIVDGSLANKLLAWLAPTKHQYFSAKHFLWTLIQAFKWLLSPSVLEYNMSHMPMFVSTHLLNYFVRHNVRSLTETPPFVVGVRKHWCQTSARWHVLYVVVSAVHVCSRCNNVFFQWDRLTDWGLFDVVVCTNFRCLKWDLCVAA